MDTPSTSTLAAVDSFHRLLTQIRARRNTINFNLMVHQKNDTLKPTGAIRSERAMARLTRMQKILLDIKYTTTKTLGYRVVRRAMNRYGSTEDHITEIFGEVIRPGENAVEEGERRFLEKLKLANKGMRQADLVTRILLEVIHRNHEGWYIVMNSLSVRNANLEEVFGENSRAFEKYIQKFKREVRLACYGKEKPTGQYHSHFAVTEMGKERGRLHFHVLHFCKALPKGCVDPNYGRRVPDYRIINHMRAWWPHGFSAPIAVRFHGGDNYGRLGWRWPVDRKSGTPVAVKASTGIQLARYMNKYLTKSYGDQKTWRTKTSRNFGNMLLRKAIRRMSNCSIESLIDASSKHQTTVMNLKMPLQQVRKEATREYLLRKRSKQSDWKKCSVQKSLIMQRPRPSIVSQYRTLTRTSTQHSPNSPTSGSTLTRRSRGTATFDALQCFKAVLEEHGHTLVKSATRGVSRP